MRVLHIISSLDVGGAERSLAVLASGLARRGTTSTVVSLTSDGTLGPELRAAGHSVVSLGLSRGRVGLGALVRLRRIVRDVKPEVIQGWMYHGDLTALLARTMTARCPVVWGVHSGSVPMREHPWLTRLVIRSCALVSSNPEAIVFASNSARQFHESLGYTGRRHLVIPNGIEAEMVQAADSRRRELRRQWRVPDEAFVVGALSRYHPMKDHATLLDAVQLLRAQGRPVFLVMAGRGLEHANEPLKQMIEDRALGGVARLLGEQKDVGAFLSTCDVLASSSVTESFPMSFLEALATGLPIVTTDVGDCADIVGDAGRVVPVRSPAKFAVALSEIADLPLESRQTLAAVARETVTRRYSVDRYVDAFAELYEAALASAEGRAARTDHN